MKKTLQKLSKLEGYGKFVHKINNKFFVSPTEGLMKLEFENKKWLYQLPKQTRIKCFEYSEENGVSSELCIFPLSDLRIIMSISYNDLGEVFYIE